MELKGTDWQECKGVALSGTYSKGEAWLYRTGEERNGMERIGRKASIGTPVEAPDWPGPKFKGTFGRVVSIFSQEKGSKESIYQVKFANGMIRNLFVEEFEVISEEEYRTGKLIEG